MGTRRLMPATGLRMLLAARNILCAKMMPMVTFPWGSRVTGTGLAREDTRGCRGAPPCWSLIRTGDGASLHQLKTVKFQQPKHLHQERRPPPPRPVGGEPLPFNLPPGAVPLNQN